MGRIRPTIIKQAARELLQRYPDKFSHNYKETCAALEELTNIESKHLRNRVAGYIVSLLKQGDSGSK
ncbi:MAG: 30S ribosomal protein S17e [Hadesarchaea archaeon]|nr:30S ribosomal protein S17e [Hadesarchaea archaeon]